MRRRYAGSGFDRGRPRWRLALAALAVTGALGFAAIEAASLAWIYLQRGAFYYRAAAAPAEAMPPALAVPDAVFHPYLGFIHRAGRTGEGWTTNNVGFQVAAELAAREPDCCDYPRARRAGEVLVGVFGGSVATGLALQAQVSATLAEGLRAIPAYHDKTVRVLNFAMPGFRQPQQLAALAWLRGLGQELDVAINIDGFNEVVTSYRNLEAGVEPTFPADTLWGEWGRQLERQAGRDGADMPERALAAYYRGIAARLGAEAGHCALASCNLAKRLLARLAHWRAERLARDAQGRPPRATLFPTALRSRFASGFDVFAYAAERWADASRAMAALARDEGAVYLHVIQPNQWWREAGAYHPIAADHVFGWVAEPVNRGYPALVARAAALRAAGVEVLDATLLFKDLPAREVYVDDCCHYTPEGNDRLAKAIADAIAAMHASGRAVAGR